MTSIEQLDEIAERGERIVVAGISGGGKSRMSRRLGDALGLPVIESDAMYHLAGWQPAEVADFRARFLAALDAAPRGWIVDGNYDAVSDELWARADTVVWLDLPRAVVMAQLLRRTISRIVRRTELYNGNRETVRSGFGPDGILVWTWRSHATRRRQRVELAADAPTLGLTLVVLRSRSAARRYVEQVGARKDSNHVDHS